MQATGNCECGKVRFEVSGEPLFRAFCHCEICQAYNRAPFADIVIMRVRDVKPAAPASTDFKHHTWPKLLSRGTCTSCGGAALEHLDIPLFPKLTIVPAQTLGNIEALPGPVFHMFYASRIEDVDDDLPKYANYLGSQLKLSFTLMSTLMRSGVK